MPRTIVYDPAPVQAHYAHLVGDTRPGRSAARELRSEAIAAAAAGNPSPAAGSDVVSNSDDFATKLIKYIPAETITLATLFFGAWTITGRWVWFWVAVGAAVNIAYLYALTFASPQTTNPKLYFYFLSAAAFVAWAIGTVDVVEKAAHVSDSAKAGFVLAFAAVAIPSLDLIFSAGPGPAPPPPAPPV